MNGNFPNYSTLYMYMYGQKCLQFVLHNLQTIHKLFMQGYAIHADLLLTILKHN